MFYFIFIELLLDKLHPSSDAARKESVFLSQVPTDRLLHQIVTPQFLLRLLSLRRSVRGRKEPELRSRLKILSRFACLIICLSSVIKELNFHSKSILALGGFFFIVGTYCFKAGLTILPDISDEIESSDQTPMELTDVGVNIKSKIVDVFNQVEYDTRMAVCDFSNIASGNLFTLKT